MERREFLKSSLALTVALSVNGLGELAVAEERPHISVVNGEKVAATFRAVDMLGGIKRFVKPGQSVVIKPNMSFASGVDVAANTDPAVVAAVVQMCKDAGATKISVLDNPLSNAATVLERSGTRDACNKIFSNCVHMVEDERFFQEVIIPNAKTLKTTKVIREVLEADVLIAVPKAKSHGGAGVSMTMKGMMGLIYNRRVFHVSSLHDCVVDLYTLLKPALTVIDASLVLTTNGPSGPGKVIQYGDIIASIDGVAADAYAVSAYEWYGRKLSPSNVGYLKEAALRGIGRIDLENLNIAHEKI